MADRPHNHDRVAIIIPTLNAGDFAHRQVAAFKRQGIPASAFLVVDSASTDDTANTYRQFGADVVGIERTNFNHGGTRRYATTLRPNADFLVMLTQDAIPASDDTLRSILEAFTSDEIGMAYGRQLPRREARGIERHARLLNYPSLSEMREYSDRERLGIKTIFSSDSFAAYRRSALMQVGNFPEDAYFAEDQIMAALILEAGWKLSYCANASVVHSHHYTIKEEFQRYFDVGVFHSRNRWLLEEFGRAEGEGFRFLKSEFHFLLMNDPSLLPSAILRTAAKYLGYRLGQKESGMSLATKRRLSMQPFYWRTREDSPDPTEGSI